MKKTCGLVGMFLLVVVGGIPAQAKRPKTVHTFKELGLTVDHAALGNVRAMLATAEWTSAEWAGDIDGHDVHVWLMKYDRKTYDVEEPGDVLGVYVYNRRDEKEKRSRWLFRDRTLLPGQFGYVPYAILGSCPLTEKSKKGRCFILCGVSKAYGYAMVVECFSAPSKVTEGRIRSFLAKGIKYDGELRDSAWTDDEARAYWKKYVDAKIHKKLRIQRTKHFIILSNAGSKLFAKKMEDCYAKIRKTFPFEEVPGRRRLPVLVFRTFDQYVNFYSRRAEITPKEAAESAGHAWLDYYATSYESPNDPVHIHEATHQLFSNRLLLDGGGSWFHEGVAEFMCENANMIKADAKLLIKYGEYVPLKRFMLIPDLASSHLGGSKRVGDAATANYRQAASIIQFLSKSKFGRKRFQHFVRTMGRVNDRDLNGMEQALMEVYGIRIDELENRWKAYYR